MGLKIIFSVKRLPKELDYRTNGQSYENWVINDITANQIDLEKIRKSVLFSQRI